MPKIFSKNNTLLLLTGLVVAQFVAGGLSLHHQKAVNNIYAQEITSLQGQTVSADNGLAYQQITVSPADKKIYFPQLNLAIPLTTLGASLVYSPDTAYVRGSTKLPSGPVDEAAISTFVTAHAPQTQSRFDCSSLVRIRFEAKPNPYNPNEIPSGSVSLANGKILQIYAYHLKACQKEWSFAQANPDAVAALFRQAQSY